MGHPQPPTPVETDNSAAKSIINGTGKQKTSRAIEMIFYWVRDRILQERNKTLAVYVTKHHPIWHHRTTRPRYLKATKKT